MSLPREPFDWDEGPDEAPIPLGGDTGEDVGDEAFDLPAAVVEEAEVVVREAQDSLAREDTDPTIPLSLLVTHPTRFAAPPSATEEGKNVHRRGGIRRDPRKAVLVVAACAVAFAHGWHQGSMAAHPQSASQSPLAQGLMSPCDPNHCLGEPKGQRWKEVQHR